MAGMTFGGEVASVRAARHFVRDLLDDAGIEPSTAMLLTSELTSNVVEHACTHFDVIVTINPTAVRIEIHDGLAVTEAFRDLVTNPPAMVAATAPQGRGLHLVGSSAARFGLNDKGPAGKAIWFELDRDSHLANSS